jgi:CheY-like chemotaxis protein
MDGSALLQAVRAEPHLAALPVIVLSADGLPAWRVRAAGGTAFLHTPHDPDVLLAFVTQHLEA